MSGTRVGGASRIGIVGADVPRQLILAAGAMPYRLFGSWHGPASPEATELLGAVDVVSARILDDILTGEHDDLAGLVVCHDSQADVRMFYVLRILAARGRIPYPVHLLDAPRGDSAAIRRFVGRQYLRLLTFCEQVTGRVVDPESLRAAAGEEEAVGRALAAMRGRRVSGACAGTVALEAYRAAATLPPGEAIAVVDAATATAPAAPGVARVYVTGSNHPDPTVYAGLEQTGLVLAGEDHDTGDAGWLGVSADGPTLDRVIEGLVAAHGVRPPAAARSLASARATHTASHAEQTGCTAALGLVRDLDDSPAWDLPQQRGTLGRRGLPLAARTRIRPDEDAVAAARQVVAELLATERSTSA
jgi:hypothetical protein